MFIFEKIFNIFVTWVDFGSLKIRLRETLKRAAKQKICFYTSFYIVSQLLSISLVPTISHVIFHLILLFNTNKDVTKNDFESLEISQDNFYDEVYFTKVSNLQCMDYNSTIKKLHLKCFSAFYKLSILLYIACNIIKKAELMLDLCVKHSTSLVEASF